MKYRFTSHFQDKWKERKEFLLKEGVTPEKVVEFAFNPDYILPDDVFPERKWHIKKVENRCLKIIVEPEGDILVIITAYFDRTLKRKGLCE